MNDHITTLYHATMKLRVIAVYRRYYDFLQSSHKEVMRNMITQMLASDGNANAEMFGWEGWNTVDAINGAQEDVFRSKVEATPMFKDVLHDSAVESKVIVLNYHKIKGSLNEKFFHDVM